MVIFGTDNHLYRRISGIPGTAGLVWGVVGMVAVVIVGATGLLAWGTVAPPFRAAP